MLEIKNLKAGYNGKAVIDLSNFSLPKGKHCLILGPSGSGKTTLLYSIAGLLQPFSGEVLIDNTDVVSLRGSERDAFRGRNIGIIYQTLHMIPALSLLDNILLAPYAAGAPKDIKRAEKLLEDMGLQGSIHKKPHELSQGQQQRAAIARTVFCKPKIVLGDEPTSALDDGFCALVMELLLDSAEKAGASLVIATHDHRIKKYFTKVITLGAVK